MRHVDELKLHELQARFTEIDENEFRRLNLLNGTISPSLKKCIEEYPIELLILFCESVCCEAGITENRFNSITQTKDGFPNIAFQEWRGLSKIVINYIKYSDKDEKEYVSLIEFIERECDLKKEWILEAKTKCERDEYAPNDFRNFIKYFFEKYEGEVQKFLFFFCWLIYRGLPIYEKKSADKFAIVSDNNHDYVYLYMNGFYKTYPELKTFYCRSSRLFDARWITYYRRSQIFVWTEKYFINNNQLSVFWEIFSNDDYAYDDESTTRLRREAYRRAIGLEDVFVNSQDNENCKLVLIDKPGVCYQTRLMEIQQNVLQRYYGDLFDIRDRDTWASQASVVDWLRKEFKLSKREAEAIDIITRPNTARGK